MAITKIRLQKKPSHITDLAILNPYTSVKISPIMYSIGNIIIAAGSISPNSNANLTPITFDTIKEVMKIAVIITNIGLM
jgi:hypothetical protein